MTISLHVQPRSRRNALVVSPQGALKAAVTAPPEDGRANDAVVALLAARFQMPKSAIAVKHGTTARDKVLLLAGEPQAIAVRIVDWMRGERVRGNG